VTVTIGKLPSNQELACSTGNRYITGDVKEAVRLVGQMCTEDIIELPPHLINPFLRVCEIMRQQCTVKLRYNFYSSQDDPKIYYEVTV
jgi:hypothetical protein